MGKSMAGHLMTKGYSVALYTRTQSKAQELLDNGAKWLDIQSLAEQSDVLFLMLGYPQDVEEVVFTKGVLQHMRAGTVLVDHTTSSPGQAQRIHEEALKRGLSFLDAPVSGGDIGAKAGKLVTMVGGDAEALERVRPLLDCYSAEV